MPSFGRYNLLRPIAKGGMAEIWKARVDGPSGFAKVLAVKKVLPELADDQSFVEMFVDEAKLVAQLVHPNVVQVFDFGRIGREYYLAMEYVEGTNLARLLARVAEQGAHLPPELAFYIAFEACRGLGYAHARADAEGNPLRIVHRDVSPQNILLSYGGEVKVTDFGIAKATSAASRTAEGHVRGKLSYMAPEQVGMQPLDERTDLFALGVVLHEMVTGRRLYGKGSPEELYARVLGFAGLRPDDVKGLPTEVKNVLEIALHPDPDCRFQDATQMETALGNVIGIAGLTQSRQVLAGLLRKHFAEEISAEHTPVDSRAPTDPSLSAFPLSRGLDATGGLQSSASIVPEAATVQTPAPLNLTLETNRRGVRVVSSSATPIAPGARSRTALVGFGIAALAVAAVAGGIAGGAFMNRGRDVAIPSPTPTAIVVATPSAAPSVAQSATPTGIALLETPALAPTPKSPQKTPVVAKTSLPVVATPPPAAGTAKVVVTGKPWAEVWVDGVKLSADTPFTGTVAAGTRRFKFVQLGFTVERSITLKPGETVKISVNPSTGAVDVSR